MKIKLNYVTCVVRGNVGHSTSTSASNMYMDNPFTTGYIDAVKTLQNLL